MTECIDPTQIEEGDLIAYVDGEAEERVVEHIARCPACAEKVKQLRNTSRALLDRFYRSDCPAPEVLGQYMLGLLTPEEKLRVAAHLRGCPLCSRELETLEREERLGQKLVDALRGVVEVVEAVLVPQPRLRPAAIRGQGERQFAYQAEGVEVLLGFQPSARGTRRGTLLGAVVESGTAPSDVAWIFPAGESPSQVEIDALGGFAFEDITPGEYDLVLVIGERGILLREVVIDEPPSPGNGFN
jgi:anti-sigma factor RsiW